MKYINTITGAVLDTASIIEGENWVLEDETKDKDELAESDIPDESLNDEDKPSKKKGRIVKKK